VSGDLEPDGVPAQAGRIQLLPRALADQIAAGEVVERPASVVKELVENALDAGARHVRIEVRDGGASLISVTDDGHGMTPPEARMALQRHATSKLRSADDLQRIASFGFRGEALPAIASVSRLRLRSRAKGAGEGWEIRVAGGELLEDRAAGGPEGTRIEVAELFANVPARRKFLKKPGTEWGHVADWLGRLALSLPDVHFEVRRDDHEAVVWPACKQRLDRIAAVLSEKEASLLVPSMREEGDAQVEAHLSPPDRSRASASGLYLFVNGRPVRDKLLTHALLDAYRDILPRGRYPTAVLFLTLPCERVDVNVHPAKWEVRFSEPQAIHRLVRSAVRDAMQSRSWLAPPGSGSSSMPPPVRTSEGVPSGAETNDWIFARRGSAVAAEDRARAGAAPEPALYADRDAEPSQVAESAAAPKFGGMRLIGQMRASYLVLESETGLVLIDQHAPHPRVLYERLRGGWLVRGVERQGLLVPVTVDLEPLAFAALMQAEALFGGLGFELESFGEAAVVVRAVPALLCDRNPEQLITDLAAELQAAGVELEATPERTRLLPVVDRIFATLACHSARRFGDHLEREEQVAILSGLDSIPWAPTCPHGRPVAASMPFPEIEKRFDRR
jgi:DNA mismatch repair protein MutL